MNREADPRRTSATPHIGTAEMSLAMWLRNGRAQKNYSLDDVARITKIQPRILERLEGGRLDGLPAEVFVRGFVRSFARCVGLDEDEALRRYSACGRDGKAPPNVGLTGVRAVIDAMGDLAPNARANTPKILRDEPEQSLAAGSMEIPVGDTGEALANDEMPVEITFAEASEVVSMPDEPAVEKLAIEQGMLEQAVIAEAVDAVVVAPPADMDLSAGIAVPAATATAGKKKRTRKAAPTDGATPKRTRRGKVATGTPAEPTPVVATDAAEQAALAVVAAKPTRRRKPRGSVQPPIIETITDTEPTTEPIADAAVDDVPAPSDASLTIETTSSDGAIAIESLAAAAPVDADVDVPGEDSTVSAAAVEFATFVVDSGASAADELFGAIDSSQTTETGGEFEGHIATAVAVDSASSVEVSLTEHHEDGATSRFERVEEDAPLQLTEAWTPRMPPFAMPATPSWRRSPAAPALVAVIDDADPEGAERALEDRRSRETRRTFLPPILLDRDGDRSTRQGGLTLAVIILLIAATLTLSYLMRRPSAAGDGVTQRDSITDTRIG